MARFIFVCTVVLFGAGLVYGQDPTTTGLDLSRPAPVPVPSPPVAPPVARLRGVLVFEKETPQRLWPFLSVGGKKIRIETKLQAVRDQIKACQGGENCEVEVEAGDSIQSATILVNKFRVVRRDATHVKSGPDHGDYPSAFNVIDVTGPSSGEKLCYRCQYGARPVVALFVREWDESVLELVGSLDKYIAEEGAEEKKMAGYVVALSDDSDATEKRVQAIQLQRGLRAIPLTLYENSRGPLKYSIGATANLTVVMWVDSQVEFAQGFSSGSIGARDMAEILREARKLGM